MSRAKTYVYWTTPASMAYIRANSMQQAGRIGVTAAGARGRKRRVERLDAIDVPIGIAHVDVLSFFRGHLDHAMRRLSLSGAALSRQVGINRNSIPRWLGGGVPRLSDALAVADVLGLSLDAMLSPRTPRAASMQQSSTCRWRESWAWLVKRHGLADLSAFAGKSTIRGWLGGDDPTLRVAHDTCVRLGQPLQAVTVGAVRSVPRQVVPRPERDRDYQAQRADEAAAPFSVRAAMRDAGVPDWEMGKGVSSADAIRYLAKQRDDANERAKVSAVRALEHFDECTALRERVREAEAEVTRLRSRVRVERDDVVRADVTRAKCEAFVLRHRGEPLDPDVWPEDERTWPTAIVGIIGSIAYETANGRGYGPECWRILDEMAAITIEPAG